MELSQGCLTVRSVACLAAADQLNHTFLSNALFRVCKFRASRAKTSQDRELLQHNEARTSVLSAALSTRCKSETYRLMLHTAQMPRSMHHHCPSTCMLQAAYQLHARAHSEACHITVPCMLWPALAGSASATSAEARCRVPYRLTTDLGVSGADTAMTAYP